MTDQSDINVHVTVSPQGWTVRLLKLGVGILSLAIWIYVITPWIGSRSFTKPLTQMVEERDINANAIYYTDLEEFSEAEHAIRDAVTYATGSSPPLKIEPKTQQQ